ncbi:MAG: hypothetical protein U0Y96_16360 [Candidatus Kapaibacterium sp.]|nr:hypothetical protein [Bacteroidota bacterium]
MLAKDSAINRASLNETLYNRVKELVIKETNQSALVALAKFRRKEDIQLILGNEKILRTYHYNFFTYKAISQFPDTVFLPLLNKSLHQAIREKFWYDEWRELYKAIASYKNDIALKLLRVPLTQTKHRNMREYHVNFIFNAIEEFYTPIYDELLWSMWNKEKKNKSECFLYSV